jgi:prevent-host-death family protein
VKSAEAAKTAVNFQPGPVFGFPVYSARLGLMDREVDTREARRRFSELLREVAQGSSFTLISRGFAVARVLPVDRAPEPQPVRKLLEFLRKLPVRHVGDWSRGDLYEQLAGG